MPSEQLAADQRLLGAVRAEMEVSVEQRHLQPWVVCSLGTRGLKECHPLPAQMGSSPHPERLARPGSGHPVEVQLRLLFPQAACWIS